jgi:hypothetical protein
MADLAHIADHVCAPERGGYPDHQIPVRSMAPDRDPRGASRLPSGNKASIEPAYVHSTSRAVRAALSQGERVLYCTDGASRLIHRAFRIDGGADGIASRVVRISRK